MFIFLYPAFLWCFHAGRSGSGSVGRAHRKPQGRVVSPKRPKSAAKPPLPANKKPRPIGFCILPHSRLRAFAWAPFQFCLLRSRSCRPTGCLRQAVLVRIPPACLTLRATYAAYRATALLLGSQRFRLSKTLMSLFVPENLQTKGFFSHPLNATRFAPFAQGIWAVIDPAWPLNSEAVCGNLGKKVSISQWVYGFKRRRQVDVSTKTI